MAGHLVPPGACSRSWLSTAGSCSRTVYRGLVPVADGPPVAAGDLVGTVLVLKELYDLSDAADRRALKFEFRWKVACGRSLAQVSFDPSTLVYWRRRIAASDRPDRVFDAVAEVIAQTGMLRGRRKRCVDSTVFDDAVATQDTVTQLVAAIRKVARVVPDAAAVIAGCARWITHAGQAADRLGRPAAKQKLVSDLVNDALAVLAELAGPGRRERDAAAADALGLLALVAGQDAEPADDLTARTGGGGSPQGRPGSRDQHRGPEARHTRKSKSKRRDGFRGHVAAEPETGLITDCEMTMAAGTGSTDADNGVKMARPRPVHPRRRGPGQAKPAGGREGQRGPGRVGAGRDGWRSTATPPMAAARPAPPTTRPATAP